MGITCVGSPVNLWHSKASLSDHSFVGSHSDHILPHPITPCAQLWYWLHPLALYITDLTLITSYSLRSLFLLSPSHQVASFPTPGVLTVSIKSSLT